MKYTIADNHENSVISSNNIIRIRINNEGNIYFDMNKIISFTTVLTNKTLVGHDDIIYYQVFVQFEGMDKLTEFNFMNRIFAERFYNIIMEYQSPCTLPDFFIGTYKRTRHNTFN